MEAVCGIVANPVARMWNGLGRSPHSASVKKSFEYYCEGLCGRGEGLDWRGYCLS